MLKFLFLSVRKPFFWIAAVAFSLGLFACEDSEETGETISLNCAGEVDSGSTTISISGYVKDGKTGSLLSGTLNLYNSTGTTFLDNSSVSSSSKYSFSNLTPSTYILKSSIPHYYRSASNKTGRRWETYGCGLISPSKFRHALRQCFLCFCLTIC